MGRVALSGTGGLLIRVFCKSFGISCLGYWRAAYKGLVSDKKLAGGI